MSVIVIKGGPLKKRIYKITKGLTDAWLIYCHSHPIYGTGFAYFLRTAGTCVYEFQYMVTPDRKRISNERKS